MKLRNKFIYLSSLILALACSRKSNPDPNSNLSAPVVDFSASQTSIYTGNVISFTDLSTEAPTSWLWNFQGGTPSTSTVQNPTNIQYNSAGTYTVTLTATNADGNNTKTKTGYITVSLPLLPTLTTSAISILNTTTAITGGNITSQGGSSVTIRGVCWNTSSTPTTANNKVINGNGSGSFSSSLINLRPNTTYYVRAYATNNNGTSYGNELSFTTTTALANCGTVTDIDGNVYHTVTIGTQCWMVENLKTTRYNDGSTIPTGLNYTDWNATSNGAYVIYKNSVFPDTVYNNTIYGKLYNWYAVNTGKLAPTGWHVPSNNEWVTLSNYLGGDSISGGKMKATILWSASNKGGATNSSGFTAVPAGEYGGLYYSFMGNKCEFWTTNFAGYGGGSYHAYVCSLNYDDKGFVTGGSPGYANNSVVQTGRSVRCIKD